MVNHQRRLQESLSPLQPAGSLSPVQSTKDSTTIPDSLPPAPDLLAHPVMGVDAVLNGSIPSIPCHAYMAAKDCYCARTNNLHAYADVNRCCTGPSVTPRPCSVQPAVCSFVIDFEASVSNSVAIYHHMLPAYAVAGLIATNCHVHLTLTAPAFHEPDDTQQRDVTYSGMMCSRLTLKCLTNTSFVYVHADAFFATAAMTSGRIFRQANFSLQQLRPFCAAGKWLPQNMQTGCWMQS